MDFNDYFVKQRKDNTCQILSLVDFTSKILVSGLLITYIYRKFITCMYALLSNDYYEGGYFHVIDILLFILFRMALTFLCSFIFFFRYTVRSR
ncbi:MAG: hypothetical protein FD188_3590 [Ignavibacteria bacterium]|nr:MAG: hypothetical protein FD188_3590 [Ignavibacteria bacterium]